MSTDAGFIAGEPRVRVSRGLLKGACLIYCCAADVAAETGPSLGRPIPLNEIAAISIHAFPDGSGLPQGSGTVAQGEQIYQRTCAACHGVKGQGASAEELAGGQNALTDDPPDKTIGRYWPYATTLFDFIQRSMPLDAPRSLTADQVYAVTAYLLHLNGIIAKDQTLDAASLARIEMPNRDGFIGVDAAIGSRSITMP
jgi:S-disulfanyl-L-cysteine oxidoreductase SoxD